MAVNPAEGASPPVFEQIFRNARFAQGGNALFEGKVKGNPRPQVVWTRKGLQMKRKFFFKRITVVPQILRRRISVLRKWMKRLISWLYWSQSFEWWIIVLFFLSKGQKIDRSTDNGKKWSMIMMGKYLKHVIHTKIVKKLLPLKSTSSLLLLKCGKKI